MDSDKPNYQYLDPIEAEELGGLFFTENEIRVILTENPDDFRTCVLKGRLVADAGIRREVVRQATLGIAEAVKQVEKWKERIVLIAAI